MELQVVVLSFDSGKEYKVVDTKASDFEEAMYIVSEKAEPKDTVYIKNLDIGKIHRVIFRENRWQLDFGR